MSKEVKEKKFEEQIKELEEIINELETGEVDLHLAIEKYTKAMNLVKSCDEKLKKIDEQVSKLVTENNEIENFDVE